MVSPLTALTKKGIKFQWTPKAERAFQILEEAFTSAPVPIHFNPEKAIIVDNYASNYFSAAVRSQHNDNEILHPMAFYSKKHAQRSVTMRLSRGDPRGPSQGTIKSFSATNYVRASK